MRDENHQRQKRRARLVEKKSRHSRVNLITVISQHYQGLVQTGVNKLFRYFLHVLYKLGVRDSVSRSRLAENFVYPCYHQSQRYYVIRNSLHSVKRGPHFRNEMNAMAMIHYSLEEDE